MSSALIGGEEQRDLLLAALDMGMVSDGYVFIPYDALLYAMPYQVTFMNPSASLHIHQDVHVMGLIRIGLHVMVASIAGV